MHSLSSIIEGVAAGAQPSAIDMSNHRFAQIDINMVVGGIIYH
jgi:hypothetical protein